MKNNKLKYSFFCIISIDYFSKIMRKSLLLFLFLFVSVLLFAQSNYPKDYFIKPLDIPLILSGSFGELRSNHFHGGLDIKTQQRIGLNVFSSADGYVSRISISHWGYGNALYVTHPNGFTTVYGHLHKFSPKIEAYIRKHQYEQESFEVKLFPGTDDLVVTKGEVIAISGNSGSSGGPHLHYEIRDIQSNVINPMHFGIDLPDHKNPTIQSVFAYSKNDSSHVNQSNKIVELVLRRQPNGDILANKVYAYGEIGIGINAYDRLDNALNQNGLYDVEMQVNGSKIYQFTLDKFSFEESRYINSYVDFERLAKLKQRVQKCFVDHPANKLSLYKTLENKGFFNIKDTLDYNVTLIAKDFKGNQTKLSIPFKGKKDTILLKKEIKNTPYFFKYNQENKILDSLVHINFPKNIFYEDFYFDYSFKNGVAQLHNTTVPVHDYFSIYFDISKYSQEEIKTMYIAKKNSYGVLSYLSSKHKDNYMYGSSRDLGNYTLAFDNVAPKISPVNFKESQWLAKSSILQIKIFDRGSGIKSYRGEINGKWILLEYDPKNGLLTHKFDETDFEDTSHTLKIVVTDNVNNETIFSTTFNRRN